MESFFLAGGTVDEIELKELLYRRYHTLEMVNTMEFMEFIDFVVFAKEKDSEEKIYMQWCAMLPSLNQYMSFSAFKEKLTGSNIDMRPAAEIISEIEALHRKDK